MKTQRDTERFFAANDSHAAYTGFIDRAYRFVCEKQLMRTDLWHRFVHQFRSAADDADEGWKGEFWGKMMRGAALVYSYTGDDMLYGVLKNTVTEMLHIADEKGRISTYSVKKEFGNWDLWCRKYVMLGMEYFLEICKEEELREQIITSLRAQADYIISKIGEEDGKLDITSTSGFWRGLNSSSILEAIVRLYSLTHKKKYLDFSEYIIKKGGTQVANIFKLAFDDGLYPYQYPTTKAYEMTSCFEGLLEYYKITGNEDCKTAVINFADKILESDFTVIGCCGCTEELFDHSAVRQANTTNGYIFQETCVTVTLMKFFSRVYMITGDPKYIDAFEISLYNAYLGSFNTGEHIEPEMLRDFPDWIAEPMPFDSYSPLTADTRGKRVGGKQLMADNHYYGCCACIGSAGIGMLHKIHVLTNETSVAVNMFIDGYVTTKTPAGNTLTLSTVTQYPRDDSVKIKVDADESEEFEILIRNPQWSVQTTVFVNGEKQSVSDGYISLKRVWCSGDTIELNLDMRTQAIYPVSYGSQVLMNNVVWEHNYVTPAFDKEDPLAKKHIALRRGPVMLAQENRLGYSVDDPVDIDVDADGFVNVIDSKRNIPYDCIIKADVPLKDGSYITLTDYSSAGKLYTEEGKMAVWILTN